MKIMGFIKEFWRDNKFSYLISCVIFSVAGLIVYGMTETNFKMQNYLVMLPFFWMGIYVLALCFSVFISWEER